uniref:Uncharacterized protein n=1 Tax=Acrobeloides nanus TaxID=290746 RepID=A0A914CCW3_9BILA
MKLLRHQAHVAPSTIFATHLNAPCSSLLLTQSPASAVYLVVGKNNGETIFFPTDRSECVSKFECEVKLPVTALASGDLRNVGRNEVVTISAHGLLQCLEFPQGDPPGPSRIFCQQLNSNVCSAKILDIDNDGKMEMIVIMTDRVVRTYRFAQQPGRLIPLNKWEMPVQISGWSIGFDSTCYVLMSQAEQNQYIKIDFASADKEVRAFASMINDGRVQSSQIIVPLQPYFVSLLHCLAERVIVVDSECNNEVELRNIGADVSCISSALLSPGLYVVVTIDPFGTLSVYGWTDSYKRTALGTMSNPPRCC